MSSSPVGIPCEHRQIIIGKEELYIIGDIIKKEDGDLREPFSKELLLFGGIYTYTLAGPK